MQKFIHLRYLLHSTLLSDIWFVFRWLYTARTQNIVGINVFCFYSQISALWGPKVQNSFPLPFHLRYHYAVGLYILPWWSSVISTTRNSKVPKKIFLNIASGRSAALKFPKIRIIFFDTPVFSATIYNALVYHQQVKYASMVTLIFWPNFSNVADKFWNSSDAELAMCLGGVMCSHDYIVTPSVEFFCPKLHFARWCNNCSSKMNLI